MENEVFNKTYVENSLDHIFNKMMKELSKQS